VRNSAGRRTWLARHRAALPPTEPRRPARKARPFHREDIHSNDAGDNDGRNSAYHSRSHPRSKKSARCLCQPQPPATRSKLLFFSTWATPGRWQQGRQARGQKQSRTSSVSTGQANRLWRNHLSQRGRERSFPQDSLQALKVHCSPMQRRPRSRHNRSKFANNKCPTLLRRRVWRIPGWRRHSLRHPMPRPNYCE
jgi:hypothetical protein